MNLNWLKGLLIVFGSLAWGTNASAETSSSGYPERVIRWKVEGNESCADIAEAVYGSGRHQNLVLRYNNVPCRAGAPLKAGMVLVLPERVTELPTAVVTYVNPDTRSRSAGGSWSTAEAGEELGQRSEVNTQESGMASIQFSDATRLFLDEHTLVIIYDTANRSAQVGTPPKVSLKRGELQAGLSALSGRDVVVELPNQARVKASSADTVVRRDDKKTNVSVFDGSAEVSSGGKKVRVPKNHGSRVVHAKAPEPPRPLPPAPGWANDSRFSALAEGGQGTLALEWKPVKNAKFYRVEVSRTSDFQNLVVRQRIPGDVLRLRAEDFPAGFYFVRVRAIDQEDFLGLSSSVARLALIPAAWKSGFGEMKSQSISSNTYSTLVLGDLPGLSVSLDNGIKQALPLDVDLHRLRPRSLQVHFPGHTEELPVTLDPLRATLAIKRNQDRLIFHGNVDRGPDGPLIELSPQLLVFSGTGAELTSKSIDLADDGSWKLSWTPQEPGSLRAELRGEHGELLATSQIHPPEEQPAPNAPVASPRSPGEWIRPVSPRLSAQLFSANMPNRADVRARWNGVQRESVVGVDARVSGAWGRLLTEAEFDLIQTPHSRAPGKRLSLGLGVRLGAPHRWSFAPGLRVGLNLEGSGARPLVSPLFAWSSPESDVIYAGHLQGDIPTLDADQHADRLAIRLLQALYYRLPGSLLAYGQLDAHTLVTQGGSFLPRGGVGAGLRWGRSWFLSLGGRFAPFVDVGEGHVTTQLGAGVILR